jgi:hypothetical protein
MDLRASIGIPASPARQDTRRGAEGLISGEDFNALFTDISVGAGGEFPQRIDSSRSLEIRRAV